MSQEQPYEFDPQGLVAMLDDFEHYGPEDPVQFQRCLDYLDGARQSPFYAANEEFRFAIDVLHEKFLEGEEATNAVIAADLELEIAMDQREESWQQVVDALLAIAPPMYVNGLRDPVLIENLLMLFEALRERGLEVTPETAPPLTAKDIRDIEASRPAA